MGKKKKSYYYPNKFIITELSLKNIECSYDPDWTEEQNSLILISAMSQIRFKRGNENVWGKQIRIAEKPLTPKLLSCRRLLNRDVL